MKSIKCLLCELPFAHTSKMLFREIDVIASKNTLKLFNIDTFKQSDLKIKIIKYNCKMSNTRGDCCLSFVEIDVLYFKKFAK